MKKEITGKRDVKKYRNRMPLVKRSSDSKFTSHRHKSYN